MRLFCWNINGLVPTVRNVDLKHGSLAAWFAHLDADIVCIQEVKLHDSKLTKDLVVVEGYQSYWACSQGKTGYSGVTTWVRHGFAASSAVADPLSCEGCDKEGRALMTDHGAFVLFNVYVPNAGVCPERARLDAKLSFLAALREKVDDLLAAGRQVILVGDFNIAAERRDVHEAINWDRLYDPSELQALQAITRQQGCNCTDTWRHLHPDTQDVYTVWQERTSSRAFNVGMRIDYALVSSGLLGKVQSCEILMDLPPKWSDHAPLLLTLDLPAPYAARTPAAAAAGTAAATAQTAQQAVDQQQQGQQQEQQQQQQQLPPAPECPMWQQLLRRFQDPSQRSIASMFRAGKPKPTAKQKPGGTPPAAAAGDAGAATALGHTDGSSAPAAAGLAGEGGASSQRVPGNSQHADHGGTVGGMQGSAAEGSQDVQTAAQGAAAAAAALSAGTAGQHAGELRQLSANGASKLEDKQQQQQQQSHRLQQQQQQQQQQPGQQSQASQQQSKVRGKPGSPGNSQQPAAGNKRKAASKAAAAPDPKQAKLHAFFARATSGDA